MQRSLNTQMEVRALTDPDCITKLCDGYGDQFRYIDSPHALYLLCSDCLFLCAQRNNTISIHVAIHKKHRGKKAIEAGLSVVNWAKQRYNRVVARLSPDEKNVAVYARWCGMRKTHSDQEYDYYEA